MDPRSFKDYGAPGPVKPTSLRFNRGQHKETLKEKHSNVKTQRAERMIRRYTDGLISDAQFRKELNSFGLKRDA